MSRRARGRGGGDADEAAAVAAGSVRGLGSTAGPLVCGVGCGKRFPPTLRPRTSTYVGIARAAHCGKESSPKARARSRRASGPHEPVHCGKGFPPHGVREPNLARATLARAVRARTDSRTSESLAPPTGSATSIARANAARPVQPPTGWRGPRARPRRCGGTRGRRPRRSAARSACPPAASPPAPSAPHP